MTGEAPGEDRRVVGERDRRHAPPSRPTRMPYPSSISRATLGASPAAAMRRARWGSRRRTGSPTTCAGAPASGSSTSSRTTPSGPARRAGRNPAVGDGGRDVDETADPRTIRRGARLSLRSRTAPVPARRRAIRARRGGRPGPPSCGPRSAPRTDRVRRVVEELRHLLVRERIHVVAAIGMRVGELGLEADEVVGRLVGERIGRPGCRRSRSRCRCGEAHAAVARPLRTRRGPGVESTMSTIGPSAGSSSTSRARAASDPADAAPDTPAVLIRSAYRDDDFAGRAAVGQQSQRVRHFRERDLRVYDAGRSHLAARAASRARRSPG